MRVLSLLAAAVVALCAARAQAAESPLLLSHHGRLFDQNDQPVDGAVKMRFTLFKSATPAGDDATWWSSGELTVQVTRGVYAVVLGTGESGTLPASAFDGAGERWLGVTVNGTPLLPRLQMGTVPLAQRAAIATLAERATLADSATKADLATRATTADALGSACAGCVTEGQLGAGIVTAAKLAASSVTGGAQGVIADGTITADDLAAGAVTGAKIAAQAITKDHIAPKSLDASVIDSSALDAASVNGFSVATTPGAGKLFPLGQNAKFPASVIDVDALPFQVAGPSLTGSQLTGTDAQVQGLALVGGELALADAGFGAGTTDLEITNGQTVQLRDGVNE